MFRPVSRVIARAPAFRAAAPTRRFLSTAPPTQKSRSWKSSAARWGIAIAGVYYYNTSDVFAEEPKLVAVQALPTTEEESETYPTIDAISQQRQQRKAAAATHAEVAATQQSSKPSPSDSESTGTASMPDTSSGGVQGLEEEAGQQGAFNPETGEINWDCPCLGGMATGPCGEEFKAAFSCFVYSTEDPKGMDCIDKFKGMQNCFRQYPEVYGAELEGDDEDDVVADGDQPNIAQQDHSSADTPTKSASARPAESAQGHPSEHHEVAEKVAHPSQPTQGQQDRAKAATEQVRRDHGAVSESPEVIPKAAHDERDAPVPGSDKKEEK